MYPSRVPPLPPDSGGGYCTKEEGTVRLNYGGGGWLNPFCLLSLSVTSCHKYLGKNVIDLLKSPEESESKINKEMKGGLDWTTRVGLTG